MPNGFAGTPDNSVPQQPQQQSQAFNPTQDYSGQLSQILAPYQQMAQKLYSPYATMSPNSWLAQNHPQVAGVLDNAFLTMGSTPQAQGPEGVGGGLSRMMQGLMGGQQYKRQQQMQMAMLPYQMAMPQLQAQDIASQIGERRASELRAEAYYNREEEYGRHNQQQEDIERQKQNAPAATGRSLVDQGNQPWQEIRNLGNPDPTKQFRYFNPSTGQYADELPPEKRPTFKESGTTSGGFLGQVATTMTPRLPGEPDADYAKRIGQAYSGLYGQSQGLAAGARTAGEQNAAHPYTDTQNLIKNERQAAYSTLPKVQSPADYQTAHLTDSDYWKNPQVAYDTYTKQLQGTKQQMDVDLNKYEKSLAPKKGVSFQEYMKDRSSYDNTPVKSTTSPKGTTAPPKPAFRFNPQTNSIEPVTGTP